MITRRTFMRSLRFAPFHALWDLASFGTSRRSEPGAVRDFAPFGTSSRFSFRVVYLSAPF
jgi:hypothetical protein